MRRFYINNKKTIFIFIGLSFVLMLLIITTRIYSSNMDIPPKSLIATVDNERIEIEEFEASLSRNRASTFSYFNDKYNSGDSKKFWTTSYEGEIPSEILKKAALDECVKNKILLLIAKEEGLVEDISYEAFLKNLQEENKERDEKLQKNEIVYGKDEYALEEFYYYYLANLKYDLEKQLSITKFNTSDQEIEEYYDETRDDLFSEHDYFNINYISIDYYAESIEERQEKKEEAIKTLEAIKNAINEGESFEQLSKQYNEDGLVGELIFENDNLRTSVRANPMTAEHTFNLQEGQVSEVFEENWSIRIIKCIERRSGGYTPLEEVKESIKSRLDMEKMNKLIEEMHQKVAIEVNEEIYNKIEIH